MPSSAPSAWPARARKLGPGVSSAASLAGLPALRKLRPQRWHEDVQALTPKPPRSSNATVRQVFSSRANEQAMPRHSGDSSRIKRPRACAGRLIDLIGDSPAVELNGERQLARLHERLVATGMAASTADRTVSLARRVFRPWFKSVGIKPRIYRRSRRTNQRVGSRGARPVPSPQQVSALLEELDAPHRLALALAVGAGLLESEILGLRFGDLRLADGSVLVQTGGIRGRVGHRCLRIEYVADWAWKLVLDTLGDPRQRPPTALVFPNRRDPSRPRSSFAPGLKKANIAAFGDTAAGFTLGAARRLWQRIQIDAGLPSAQSRQTWSLAEFRGDLPWWAEEAHGVARSWEVLCRPPVEFSATSLRVPRKKPKGCQRGQAERATPAEVRPMALPDYCRALPVEPMRADTSGGVHRDAWDEPPSGRHQAPAPSPRAPVLVQLRSLPKRDLERLAEEISKRVRTEPSRPAPPRARPNRVEQADADFDKQLRAINRRIGALTRVLGEVAQRRSAEDLVLAVLAGAGGGFAAQNADELMQRLQHVLQSVGVPPEETAQHQPDGGESPESPLWAGYYRPQTP